MNTTQFPSTIATVRARSQQSQYDVEGGELRDHRISADSFTEGDVLLHLCSRILVITEPEYKIEGIVFDGLWLDVDCPNNIQQFCFDPNYSIDLVSHIPISNSQLAA